MNAEEFSESANSVGNFFRNPQLSAEVNTGLFLIAIIIVIALIYISYSKKKSNIMA